MTKAKKKNVKAPKLTTPVNKSIPQVERSSIEDFGLSNRFKKFFKEVLNKELTILNLKDTLKHLGFKEDKKQNSKYFLLYTWSDGTIAGSPSSEGECSSAINEALNHDVQDYFVLSIWDIDSCERVKVTAEIKFE